MWNKTAVALTAAMMVAGAQAAELASEKDVKFEVNVDVGAYYVSQRDAAGKEISELKGKGLNQVEIKASRKIDADISIFGEIEVDYDPVVDNSAFTSDDTRVGIDSKSMGKLSIGQFDSYMEDNVMEVLGFYHGENPVMTEPSASNDGRHVQYAKKLGDLTFAVDYTSAPGPAATNSENSNGYALSATYKLGDLTLGAGYGELAKYTTGGTAGTLNTDKISMGLAATYAMGNLSLKGLYAQIEGVNKVKTSYTGVGLTYVMGAVDFGLAMQTVSPDNGGQRRDEWAVGVGYTPFKGMQVYLDFAGLSKANGEGDGAELGIKYTF